MGDITITITGNYVSLESWYRIEVTDIDIDLEQEKEEKKTQKEFKIRVL